MDHTKIKNNLENGTLQIPEANTTHKNVIIVEIYFRHICPRGDFLVLRYDYSTQWKLFFSLSKKAACHFTSVSPHFGIIIFPLALMFSDIKLIAQSHCVRMRLLKLIISAKAFMCYLSVSEIAELNWVRIIDFDCPCLLLSVFSFIFIALAQYCRSLPPKWTLTRSWCLNYRNSLENYGKFLVHLSHSGHKLTSINTYCLSKNFPTKPQLF